MSLILRVDQQRWRANQARVNELGDLVPVAKGNGYGFGLARLAQEATALGVDTLAVGTYAEVAAVGDFAGDIVVLTPWREFDHLDDARIIHTIGRLEDLEHASGRVLLELVTSMKRHGFSPDQLDQAARIAGMRGLQVEGVSIHLPLAAGVGEMERLMAQVQAAEVAGPIWVSHLNPTELTQVRERYPQFSFRPRIGTDLWLGDRGALRVQARVLDVHPIRRGEAFGYRGRRAPRSGHLLIASGGTAHGIGLVAPSANSGVRDRAVALAKGGLEASGVLRSPYSLAGEPLRFAEPPHMQSSMLWAPKGVALPAIGDLLDVAVRFTATTFDGIVFN
ncbi:MAG TPA: alanine racemase [Marmoricola sp.]|nr:alanine racemase [Marmoricola sp.]